MTPVLIFVMDELSGQELGPYTLDEIQTMVYQKKLKKKHLVRKSDYGQWFKAQELLGNVFVAVEEKKAEEKKRALEERRLMKEAYHPPPSQPLSPESYYPKPSQAYPQQPNLLPHRGNLILILGLMSLGLNFCAAPGVLALIFGWADLKKMKAGTMDRSGRGLTMAGYICGIIGTFIVAIGLVVFILYLTAVVSLFIEFNDEFNFFMP